MKKPNSWYTSLWTRNCRLSAARLNNRTGNLIDDKCRYWAFCEAIKGDGMTS